MPIALAKLQKTSPAFHKIFKSPVSVACVHGKKIGVYTDNKTTRCERRVKLMRLRFCLLSIEPDCHFRPSEESGDTAVSTKNNAQDSPKIFFFYTAWLIRFTR